MRSRTHFRMITEVRPKRMLLIQGPCRLMNQRLSLYFFKIRKFLWNETKFSVTDNFRTKLWLGLHSWFSLRQDQCQPTQTACHSECVLTCVKHWKLLIFVILLVTIFTILLQLMMILINSNRLKHVMYFQSLPVLFGTYFNKLFRKHFLGNHRVPKTGLWHFLNSNTLYD